MNEMLFKREYKQNEKIFWKNKNITEMKNSIEELKDKIKENSQSWNRKKENRK